jgi:tRNA(Phe) wybutosine-synthesizing methylase Tyw3
MEAAHELVNIALETGFLEMGLLALGAPAGLVMGIKMFKRFKK